MGQNFSIVVVGAGYVGLTSGACLASLGHDVVCVDKDDSKIAALRSGKIPIYEPKLEDLVLRCVRAKNLRFSSQLHECLSYADFVFLCLPTPIGSDGAADLGFLESVCEQIQNSLDPGTIVVNKSTAPVNTVGYLHSLLGGRNPVVTNPEFLREGSAVDDFLYPDRIVIGCDELAAGQKVASIYSQLKCPVVITNPTTAEAIKYFANAFLALKVSFINEAAEFCHATGADVIELARALAMDPRIGDRFLNPGPGWGGSCFPKDLQALSTSARNAGIQLETIESAASANRKHIRALVKLIESYTAKITKESLKIAFLGLTFKENTDDVRESPAVAVIRLLAPSLTHFVVYDPTATRIEEFEGQRVRSLSDALDGAGLVVILTGWAEFARIDPQWAKTLIKGNTIIDTRYILDKARFRNSGIDVLTLG